MMSSFVETLNPTPFGFFDSETAFQSEADSIVTFVKRKLGDDTLSVELSKKEIWTCLEESCLVYGRHIHEMRTKGELVDVLGLPTGSTDLTNKYPRGTLEYLVRQAEPYASLAYAGGDYDATLCYIDTISGVQDYNIYSDLKVALGAQSGSLYVDTLSSGSKGKIRIVEVFHFEPLAAQQMLLNASNITNFLATNFNYESYVNSTVFYVLPVFEDVLRRGMLETAFRVRRSQYSYQIIGSNLRIFPVPFNEFNTGKMFIKVMTATNPLLDSTSGVTGSIGFQDDSIYGVSSPSNIPFGNIPYATITSPGRQWIREYTLALSKEVLGLIRSKFDSVPIPNADVKLNGAELVAQAREDKEKLTTQLVEFLDQMTPDKLMEREVAIAENVQKQLKMIPIPGGGAIIIG